MANDLLNPRLGLSGLLDPLFGASHLPDARPLAANAAFETGLAQHFNFDGSERILEAALAPKLRDDELLRPDVFRRNLRRAFAKLKNSRDPNARGFLREDFTAMMEDGELLDVYAGLLLDG
jgi:hypothetical protein